MTINASRREFLRVASAVSTVAGTATPWALNLAGIGAAAAQTAPSDYKALVCVFLFGGNDHSNTIVPYDQATYDQYAASRGNLPLARAALLPINTPANPSMAGRQVAFRPEMLDLQALYSQGRAAVLANVGPLIVPTSMADYRNRRVPLPLGLFSHNDQQSTWMTGAREGARIGYGGLLGDYFVAAGANQYSNFTCMSASGTSVFLSGTAAIPMQITGAGAVTINAVNNNTLFGGTGTGARVRTVMTENRGGNWLENDYNAVNRRAVDSAQQLNSAIQTVTTTPATFRGGNLGAQLRSVARIIAARTALGSRRQVFFVSIGGFDQHSGLVAGHGTLWQNISQSISDFYTQLAADSIDNNVVTFTASDFGRTLDSNGQGSDHGWGAHHVVVGGTGALRGGEMYGTWPASFVINSTNDVGRGNLLPTTSVDQYAATLARWFGVPSTDMNRVVPRVGNWSTPDLGFLI
jgi:uncharacterized protein (DUF1501 family)